MRRRVNRDREAAHRRARRCTQCIEAGVAPIHRPQRAARKDRRSGVRGARSGPAKRHGTIHGIDVHLSNARIARYVQVRTIKCVRAFRLTGGAHGEVLQLMQVTGIEQVTDVLLADLEDHVPANQRRGGRAEIEVGGRVRVREVVQQVQCRIELQHALPVIAGCDVRIGVARADEKVAAGVDRRATGLPDRALPRVGRDIERDLAGPALRQGHHPSVIRPAITRVAAVADVHATVPHRQPRPLLYVQRVLHATRIRVRGNPHRPRRDIQTDQLMMDDLVRVLDRRDNERDVRGRVDDRRRGDSQRVDVSAPDLSDDVRHRRADMTLPQHMTVVGVQRVHRVVLGRCEHATGDDQRLRVHASVQRGFPRLTQRQERRFGRVITRPGRVPVIDDPNRSRRRNRTRQRQDQSGRHDHKHPTAPTHPCMLAHARINQIALIAALAHVT